MGQYKDTTDEAMELEREKEKRREAIRAEIDRKTTEKDRVNGIKSEYMECQAQIEEHLSNWDGKKEVYYKQSLSHNIQVRESFEGQSAGELAVIMPHVVGSIQETADKMADVNGGIRDQCTKIEEYIQKIEKEIGILRAELDAI